MTLPTMQTKRRVTWRAPLMPENFEVIAEAAVAAMFWVDGRIDPTPSAKVLVDENLVIATRAFKARFRKELNERGFDVRPEHRKAR